MDDLNEARRDAEESAERARKEAREALARARKARSLAQWLRRLREENGFDRLFEEAYGRGR
ncbi:hypothetical protein [Nonomuraea sp. NPDC050310]|uniref:DUF7620 family protein n=1 Tax=Nonomuraea sp. NPDC050310 TaxID=3154935 RepID=UPI003403ADB3